MRKKNASKVASKPATTTAVKRKYTGTTAEQFVAAWQGSSDIHEVAKATGMTAAAARARCFSYRKRGIKLKRFDAAPKARLDVAALNKLAKASAK